MQSLFKQLWHYRTVLLAPLLTAWLIYSGWLTALDNLLYDALLRRQPQTIPDNVMVIAIDDASLLRLGAWPWPRQVHAQLIHTLNQAGARALVFDVLFSESADAEADQALIDAASQYGNVFLPVYISKLGSHQQLIERLPLSSLANVAKGLGHIHYPVDSDGVTRSIFLNEGLQDAFWPHLSATVWQALALDDGTADEALQQASQQSNQFSNQPSNQFSNQLSNQSLPGLRAGQFQEPQVLPIKRDFYNLLPYFSTRQLASLSYVDVLQAHIPPTLLKDKVIFIGATAPGLGDQLTTPATAVDGAVAGVEFNALIYSALVQQAFLQPLSYKHHYALSLALVILVVMAGFWMSPARLLVTSLIAAALCIIASASLMLYARYWWPSLPAVTGMLLAYPLWGALKTNLALRFLRREYHRLQQQNQWQGGNQLLDQPQDLNNLLNGLCKLQVINQWSWQPVHYGIIQQQDVVLNGRTQTVYWQLADQQHKPLVEQLIAPYSPQTPATETPWEVIEATISRLQQAQHTAQHHFHFIQQTLTALHNPILICNRAGGIIFANPAAQQQLDLTHLAQANLLDILNIWCAENSDTIQQHCQQLLINSQPVEWELENQRQQHFMLHGNIARFEQAGDVAVIVLTDITTIKQLEHDRAEALHLLSHDLRSPLVSALSIIESQQEQITSSSKTPLKTEILLDIRRYVQRSLDYAESFLQLAKAQNIDQTHFYPCDLYSIVDQAMAQVMPAARRRGIKLCFDADDHDFWVQGNAELLERMVINLLDNACKYSHDKQPVNIKLNHQGKQLCLRIQDHGIGMARHEINQLFNSFERSRSSQASQRKGIGLGLRLVHQVCERHQGSIHVESTLDQGSCFAITLPLLEL